MAARVVEAPREVVAEIGVADRLAGRERAVAEHQERLDLLHSLDLARQRLEESGRPHDPVGHTRFDEGLLERQLGLLESERRLLHADRRQHHHLWNTGVFCHVERLHMRAVVDGPGIVRRTGARGQARHQHVEVLAAEAVARQRGRVGGVADAHGGAGEKPLSVVRRQLAAHPRPWAHQAHRLVAAPQQRAHARLTDRTGGAENEDTAAGTHHCSRMAKSKDQVRRISITSNWRASAGWNTG